MRTRTVKMTYDMPFSEAHTFWGWVWYWTKYYTFNNFLFRYNSEGTFLWFPYPSVVWDMRKKMRHKKENPL